MKVSLIVSQGKLVGKEIAVRLPQFVIGRDPECQLRPNSPLVSKRHCAVLVRENRVFLRDFESTNGTLLNEAPVKGETELHAGDEFKVGPIAFRIKIEATVVDTPNETPVPSTLPRTRTNETPRPVAPGSKVDEDSVLEMLLTDGMLPPPSNDPIPPGSTVMEMMNLGTEDGSKPDEKKDSRKDKKIPDAKATSDAAKAILDKYMRRPRG